jgi:hypothetical protein
MATSDIENLWGELPTDKTIGRTPLTMLQEQATVLGESTENLLVGEIARQTINAERFGANFFVVAPSLNHYRYHVLHIEYPIGFYPVHVRSEEVEANCNDEGTFKDAIVRVLRSERVRGVIQKLLNHILTESTSSTG